MEQNKIGIDDGITLYTASDPTVLSLRRIRSFPGHSEHIIPRRRRAAGIYVVPIEEQLHVSNEWQPEQSWSSLRVNARLARTGFRRPISQIQSRFYEIGVGMKSKFLQVGQITRPGETRHP